MASSVGWGAAGFASSSRRSTHPSGAVECLRSLRPILFRLAGWVG